MAVENNKEYMHGMDLGKLRRIKELWQIYREDIGLEGEAATEVDITNLRLGREDRLKVWYEISGRER